MSMVLRSVRSDRVVYRLTAASQMSLILRGSVKSDMDNAGLTDIIEGRAALYDEEMAAAE